MHDESFTDPEVAKVLNEKFVPVKVDKEEYPEVDQYLQMACHLISGLAFGAKCFLTPDNKPFVSTYFPANPNENVPSFKPNFRNGRSMESTSRRSHRKLNKNF